MKSFPVLWLAIMCLSGFTSAQTFRWVKFGQGATTDPPNRINLTNGVACSVSQVAATGFFSNTTTFDTQSLSSWGGADGASAFTGQWATSGNNQWLQMAGGPLGTTGRLSETYLGTAIGMDGAGNSYVVYNISNDAVFDTIVVHMQQGIGIIASVLVKYTPAGRAVWVRKFESGGTVSINSVAVTPAGTVAIAGGFTGVLTIGIQTIVSTTLSGYLEAFVADFDADGNPLWARHLPTLNATSTAGYAIVRGVAVDNTGNVLVTGDFNKTFALSSSNAYVASPPPPSVTSIRDPSDVFVAKYTAQGVFLWGRQIGGPGWDNATAVATDAVGNVFIGGKFGAVYIETVGNTATFASTQGTPTVTLTAMLDPRGNSRSDGYVARYDPQGTLSWAQSISGLGWENISSLATSAQGAVYVSGSAYSGTRFGTSTVFQSGLFGYNGFVAKYEAVGSLRWLTGYGSTMRDNDLAGMCLASDGAGHLYIGGAFQGNMLFGNIQLFGALASVYYPYIAAIDDNELILSGRSTSQLVPALTAYPNPSTGRVQLEWPSNLRPSRLDVRDVLGRLLHTETVPPAATAHTLELTKLPRGTYLVQLQTAGQQLTRRLVLE